ncbi:aldolase [Jaminaea rosea]|uniref:Aldolase n=1 Tax=Jaminaea rosea TaxID=1569628 RepID=A0A316UWG6_9BASI|nr:aldolase [Jaminaea rosea]PWN28671.1 aldolase [Jaminaea rosea]
MFRGVLAAVPTPFSADGLSLDLSKIQPLVDRLADANCTGVVVTGTTGEFTSLTPEEHKAVIRAYVAAVGDRPLNVVAGFGALNTRAAEEMAQWCAQTRGIDAIMVVPPFYERLSFEALQFFLCAVSTACGSLDIVYYHVPSATGLPLTADQMRELAKIPRMRYIKDTSGNAPHAIDHVCNTAAGQRMAHFNGTDTFTFAALAMGAEGVAWGVASVAPYESVALYQALVEEQDLKQAKEIWSLLYPIAACLESVNYPAGVKAALDVLGLPMGPVRAPTLPLSGDDVARLKGVVARVKK